MATESLQRRLAAVQLDLEKTQKALGPAPRAKLTFSFFPYKDAQIGSGQPTVPVTEVALPVSPDNTVHVEIVILNMTEVDAMDGQYTTLICDQCKYVKEPEGFTKLEGRSETERYTIFAKIPAHSQYSLAKLDISVPDAAPFIPIGMMYRCHTCELPRSREGLEGTIRLLRNTQ